MPLSSGTRIGPYEIVAAIGAGGMGEVYRARDTRLHRDVAIKILPEALAADPERIARLEREAKTLAALNHPNIAAIYGLEEGPADEGPAEAGRHRMRALVMELVEGEDLAQKLEGLRVKGSGLPIDEALPIARQIAEALEYAHEHGVVHRDLKPANIKLTPDGAVKVLDFGLAKALEGPGGAGRAGGPGGDDLANSPTITSPAMTRAGVILGTAAYMSPEQAKGKAVDKRTDIWAFGCVVYELLAGRRAFAGDDVTDLVVAVMAKEPDWTALPPATPPRIVELLKRCLKKGPRERLHDIADARLDIEEAIARGSSDVDDTAATRPAMPRGRLAMAASVAVVVVAVVTSLATWALVRPAPAKLQPMRFAIVPPATQALAFNGDDRDLAVSPDGTHLVYVGAGAGGMQLMVRAIDQLDAMPLLSTVGARSPFFSPDGRWIGFFTSVVSGELKKVSITGGPPILLCRYLGFPVGASWGPDDTIVFATNNTATGLLRVSSAGGEPTVLTRQDAAHGELYHFFPSVLPGARAVVFTITSSGPIENAQVAVLNFTTGQRKTLIRGGSQAEYVETGHLVYAAGGTLRAVRFDPVRLEVLSDPVPVVESVMTLRNGAAEFSVSRQGALVYVPGGSVADLAQSLVWVTRQGQEDVIKTAPPGADVRNPHLSPDGTRVALEIGQDIWIWDLARQTLTRLTDASIAWYLVWTSDSRRIIFTSLREGIHNLFWRAADNTGTVERLTTSPNDQFATSISPDGTRLIVMEAVQTDIDLRVLRLEGGGLRQTEPLVRTTFTEGFGEVSPDGQWLAYESNESGQFQIYVRPFPNVDRGHWTISTSGGTRPLWARSGKELFYFDGTSAMTTVSVHTTPTFSAGTPTTLFDGRSFYRQNRRNYDVSPDGQRFLMVKDNATGDQRSTPASMVVVLNWFEELKARVSAR